MLPVEAPFKTYASLDGKPLNNGYVYFGLPNQNPLTAPVTVFWDADGTQPAVQPLRTVNGYIMRAGTPANIFFDGVYSELVRDSKKRLIFFARTSDEFSIGALISRPAGASVVGSAAWYAGMITGFDATKMRDGTTVIFSGRDARNDGGGGAFTYSKASTQSVDGGTVFAPIGGGRLIRNGWTVFGFNGELNLKWFGAVGDFVANDTPASQLAIDAQVTLRAPLRVPAGTYKMIPATSVIDESNLGGTFLVLASLIMRSGMNIIADPGASFKIADSISTDAAPQSMRLLFSNEFLNDIQVHDLTMDMNGQNNKISPNRATFAFNRWVQAHLCFSGTSGGIAAGANNVHIEGCKFLNGPGVSCIVMAQSNSVGVALGSGWTLLRNRFYNNGLDTDDHSSVFGWATDCNVLYNTFDSPAPPNAATHTGAGVAYEIHGSNTLFQGNIVRNYGMGLWVSINVTEDAVRNTRILGNHMRVSSAGLDFYSANLGGTGPSPECPIQHVLIADNAIEITDDVVLESVKAFFKMAARKQPTMVRIHGNVCRSYSSAKSAVLVLIIVSPGQLVTLDQITVCDNTAAGLTAGMVAYFSGGAGGSLDIGRFDFANNRLGYLVASPDGLYPQKDIVLYGPSAGRVGELRVYGLEHPTSPIHTDAHAAGRATVSGKALLDLPVAWPNVVLGNGTTSNRIALDTDAGHAVVSLQIAAGTTTTAADNVYPSIAGIVATSAGALCGVANYPGASYAIGGRIDNTGSFAMLYAGTGLVTSVAPAALVAGSAITLSGNFPCGYASI